MNTLLLSLLALLLLYFLSALFCCIETAFISANRVRLRELSEQGNARAVLAKTLLENSGSFFGTVLLGTNLAHVSITTLVRSVVAVEILRTGLFRRIAEIAGLRTDAESIITSIVVTPTLLLLTELVPKAIGRNNADNLILTLAYPLLFFRSVLSVPVRITDFFSSRLARLLGVSRDGDTLGKVTRDDLLILADVATENGVLHKESGKIMTTVLSLADKPIETIMVPLVDMKSLPITATVEDVELLAAATGYTRFPVYSKRIDEVAGVISLRKCMFEGSLYDTSQPIEPLVDREVPFVPESQTVGMLMSEFRKSYFPMAMVVDEYGGVVGVVTVEDLVGILAGGMQDLRNQTADSVLSISSGVFICDGKTDIRELEPLLGFTIENQGYETAAGLALKLFGTIPRNGDKVEFRNYIITVLEVDKHRIVKLKFNISASD